MNQRIKRIVVFAGLAVTLSLAAVSPTSAATSILIDGTITDRGKPAAGLGVVAWCGGLDYFGGWDRTDEHGRFEIHTDSAKCPLGVRGFLEIFRDDSPVGFAFVNMTIQPHTLVNVKLEDHGSASVPEFGWAGGAASLLAGGGAIVFGRRRVRLKHASTIN